MKRYRILTLMLPFLLGAFLPNTHALNNKELIALHKAGLSEDLILTKMDQESAEFDLSTDGLIQLKKAGLSEKVIHKALMSQQQEGHPAGAQTSSSDKQNAVELPSIAPPKINPESGKTYFMRHSLHYEKGQHLATNYARGEFLPINTEVELLGIDRNKLRLRRLDTDAVVTITNVPKHTNASINELAQRMLADEKTPLEQLPDRFANAIRTGEPRLGMTRELVLMARGYPPGHATPSLQGDRWTYWSSRFVQQTLVFEGDHLVEGRGIH